MIPNFAIVDEGSPGVYRGGQPVTQEDWDSLKALGVQQVIKLNYNSEGSDAAWTGELFRVPESFCEQLITEPDIEGILSAVAFIRPGTFIHCKHGQDRTGLVVGAYRLKQGWTKAKAHAEMKAHGFHEVLFGLDRAWADLPEPKQTLCGTG